MAAHDPSTATETVARPAPRRAQPQRRYQPEQAYQPTQRYQAEPPYQPAQQWQPEQQWQPRDPGPGQQQPWEPGAGATPGGRRPRWPVIAGIALGATLLGSGAGIYVLVAHPFSHPGAPSASGSNAANSAQFPGSPAGSGQSPAASVSPASTGPATPTTPPTPTTSPAATQQQAATALAALLSQSSSDRSAINQAYNDVSGCGPSLSQDQQTFQQAATNRQNLIAKLGNLAGAQTLPAAMLSDLTGAWRASMQADQDYAQWAGDQSSNGCTQQAYSDPAYVAASGPNQQATSYKQSFVALWNPIAQKYGLTTYTQDTL